MGQRSNEEVVNAYLRAWSTTTGRRMGALRHPDWMVDYPQSGERIRGHANDRAIADNYPGGIPDIAPEPGRRQRGSLGRLAELHLRADRRQRRHLVRPRQGALSRTDPTWYVASIYHLRDGLIHHEITYWARAVRIAGLAGGWVERDRARDRG